MLTVKKLRIFGSLYNGNTDSFSVVWRFLYLIIKYLFIQFFFDWHLTISDLKVGKAFFATSTFNIDSFEDQS